VELLALRAPPAKRDLAKTGPGESKVSQGLEQRKKGGLQGKRKKVWHPFMEHLAERFAIERLLSICNGGHKKRLKSTSLEKTFARGMTGPRGGGGEVWIPR